MGYQRWKGRPPRCNGLWLGPRGSLKVPEIAERHLNIGCKACSLGPSGSVDLQGSAPRRESRGRGRGRWAPPLRVNRSTCASVCPWTCTSHLTDSYWETADPRRLAIFQIFFVEGSLNDRHFSYLRFFGWTHDFFLVTLSIFLPFTVDCQKHKLLEKITFVRITGHRFLQRLGRPWTRPWAHSSWGPCSERWLWWHHTRKSSRHSRVGVGRWAPGCGRSSSPGHAPSGGAGWVFPPYSAPPCIRFAKTFEQGTGLSIIPGRLRIGRDWRWNLAEHPGAQNSRSERIRIQL